MRNVDTDERLRAVALLQQKAAALKAEVAERERTETELRRRTRELTALMETAAVGLHWVGPDGTILWANAAELKMLGYQPDEYIGRPIFEFHADRDVIDGMLARLRCGECLRDFEARVRCKDGSIKHVLIDSSVLWENEKFVHTQCFMRDITEQKRAERALAEAARQQTALYEFVERRFRACSLAEIHDAALHAIVTALGCDRAAILLCDDAGVMRFAAARGLSDAYRQAVEGHSPWDLNDPNPQPVCIPDVAAAELDDALKGIVLGEGIRALAFIPLLLHGRLGGKFMTYYNAPHVFGPDEISLSLTIARQLGLGIDRKRAEQELRAGEQCIRQLLTLMPAAVYTCDARGRITFFNRRAVELWGCEPSLLDEDRKFCGALRLWRPDGSSLPHAETPMALAVARGQSTRNGEVTIERPDGSRVLVSVNIDPLYDSDEQVCGAINVFQDITERKKMEEAIRHAKNELEARVQERTASLREAMAQMEEFSYTVSHDLRAPVRAMHGYAEIVMEDYGDRLDETALEYLDRIIRGGRRMDQLIQDILTYSRLSRREVQLKPLNLDSLVREIVQQYPSMRPPAATIVICGTLPAVFGHEPSLVQAISNLLTNATKFVTTGIAPKVRVRCEPRGSEVRLWVEDNGIGIRPEHQHRLFGLFERIHPEQRYEGTGIGLAIVRKAVERMGGTAGVESDGISGSNFWIQLPAA